VVSLLAAGCFGIATALQHRVADRIRRRTVLHPGLILDLLRQPWWLLGAALDIVGVMLHLWAVNVGALSMVQPLLSVGLVVALVVQALQRRTGVGRRQLAGVALVIIGLAAFLAVVPGKPATAEVPGWATSLIAGVAVITLATAVAVLASPRIRCVALGVAAGVSLAMSAGLAKTCGMLVRADGIGTLPASWQLWSMLGFGLAGTLLSQAAFQAGALGSALAAIMVADPVTGVGLGITVFGEQVANGPLSVMQGAALLASLTGVWLLAVTESRSTPRDHDTVHVHPAMPPRQPLPAHAARHSGAED
jgi:hypothetical protein